MSELFEQTEINGMNLANRFVRSATWEGMAGQEGEVTPRLVKVMTDLAEGGVGLIISSHAYVRKDGQAGLFQLGIYEDVLIKGLETMTAAVHARGGKIVAQLAHAGLFGNTRLSGEPPVAVSALEGYAHPPRKVMEKKDIDALVEAFGRAAGRAQDAGFDGVQLHVAHGYLLNQFLSPAFNKREDDYGGTVENRARAVLEVLHAVRDKVGKGYPVLIKMNCEDFLEGGIRSFHVAEKLVVEGYADYISMSRPFIREPELVKRWASGDLGKAQCLSDNQCFGPGMAGEGVYCVTKKQEDAK